MPYHLNYENLDSSDLYSFKFSGPEAGSVHRPCERSGSKAGSVHHTRRKTRIWGSQLLQILGFDVAWGHLTSPGKNCCIKMVFLTKFWGVLRFWSFDIAWEKGAPVAVKIFYKYIPPPPLSKMILHLLPQIYRCGRVALPPLPPQLSTIPTLLDSKAFCMSSLVINIFKRI